MEDIKKRRGFVKGKPKTGGRQPGTPNKVTKSTKEEILAFTTRYFTEGEFTKDFKMLAPSDRVKFSIDLVKHVVPKAKDEGEAEFESAATTALRRRLFGEDEED